MTNHASNYHSACRSSLLAACATTAPDALALPARRRRARRAEHKPAPIATW